MNHDELMAFLDARAERVRDMNKKFIGYTGPESYFPSAWWPGWSWGGWSLPKDCDAWPQATRFSLTDPDWVWSHIMLTPYCLGPSVPVLDRKTLPPLPNVNTDWDQILSCLNNVGRPSGSGEFRRPEGPFVLDLVKDPKGRKLLEAAHAVAHARAMAEGEASEHGGFLEALAEMFLAMRWHITFHCPTLGEILGDDRARGDEGAFGWHGIKVVTSTRPRKPWLTMPAVGPQGPRVGKDCIAVLVGVHLEAEPWSTREGNPNTEDETWLELNRWSCMPSLLCLSGWKGMDELMKAPLVLPYKNSGKEDVCATMPVTALDPPSALDALVAQQAKVSSRCANPALGTWFVEDFLESRWLKALLSVTPPLPCRDCLRLNMASPGAPTRPATRRPDMSKVKGRKGQRLDDAEREWAEYDAKVDRIFKVVDKACRFHDMRFGYGLKFRKLRSRNSKKVAELLDKIAGCRKRMRKFASESEYTKAAVEELKAADAKKEMAMMMEGGSYACTN